MTNELVLLKDNLAKTTSIKVAEVFGKDHGKVVQKIRQLAIETAEVSNEAKNGLVNGRNFALVDYTDAKGEKRPAYEMTRDGFFLLAMGFTGKQALKFKIDFIDAFNRMEQFIQTGGQLIAVKGHVRRQIAKPTGKPRGFNEIQRQEFGGIVKAVVTHAAQVYGKQLDKAFGVGQLPLPMKGDNKVTANDNGAASFITDDKAAEILKAEEWTIGQSEDFLSDVVYAIDRSGNNTDKLAAFAKGLRFAHSALVHAETVSRESLFACGMATEGKKLIDKDQALNMVKHLHQFTLHSGFTPHR